MTVPRIKTIPVGDDRWYVNEETGERVPGVSAITGMMPKPGLLWGATRAAAEYALDNYDELSALARKSRWAAVNAIKGAHQQKWNKLANEGTGVHKAAEKWMRADMAGIPAAERRFLVTSHEKACLRNYIRFCREFAVTPVLIEQTVWNEEYLYAGTFDSVLQFGLGNNKISPGLKLVDVKSGASGVWPEAALQQTAYRWAPKILNEDGGHDDMPEVDEAFALWLRPEGFSLIPLETGPESWEQFKRLRASYDWKIKHEKSAVGNAVNENPLPRKR
jgi:hypothetical protein